MKPLQSMESQAERALDATYGWVDALLMPWAEEHGARVYKRFRDDVVRTFDVPNYPRARYQIWIDPPNESGSTTVHVWRRTQRGAIHLPAGRDDLLEKLNQAYDIAMSGKPTGAPIPPPTLPSIPESLRPIARYLLSIFRR